MRASIPLFSREAIITSRFRQIWLLSPTVSDRQIMLGICFALVVDDLDWQTKRVCFGLREALELVWSCSRDECDDGVT